MKKDLLHQDISIGHVSLVERALFAKHLSVMLKAGLTIIEALEIAADSSRGKMRNTILQVKQAVLSGSTLSRAFGEHPHVFPPLFVQTTYAGEAGGTLVENLENIAAELEKEKELVAKIRGAMWYPIVVLTAAFFLGMGIAFFILPKIVPLLEGLRGTLPPTTRALIWFAHLVEAHGFALFFGSIATIFVLTWLLRERFMQPFTHWILLHAPLTKSISRGANLARFCRTLGTLIKSGVTIDEALAITQETLGNYYYRQSLLSVSAHIGKSAKLWEGLEQFKNLYPPIVTKMVRVGEESGQFEDVLLYLANFYETEIDTATKSLATAIEPILLILIGTIVGGLALSIITPIYQITGGVTHP